jgi:hypothetical protein
MMKKETLVKGLKSLALYAETLTFFTNPSTPYRTSLLTSTGEKYLQSLELPAVESQPL